MAGRPQGYGITQQDMDASRLVFVGVKGAKPRRKVAVPVPDSFTWQDFCKQVRTKLKLSGIEGVYLASTGEEVSRIDDLQDIDELHVVESSPPPPAIAAAHTEASGHSEVNSSQRNTGNAPTSSQLHGMANGHAPSALSVEIPEDQQSQHSKLHRHQSMQRHQALSPGSELSPAPDPADAAAGDSSKYVRRTGRLRRFLQRLLPASLFHSALPLTTRDLPQTESKKGAASGRRRRRQRTHVTMRNMLSLLVLLVILGTMLTLYNRVSPRLPGINGM